MNRQGWKLKARCGRAWIAVVRDPASETTVRRCLAVNGADLTIRSLALRQQIAREIAPALAARRAIDRIFDAI